MNRGDGLAPGRPVASKKEYLAGLTSRREEDVVGHYRSCVTMTAVCRPHVCLSALLEKRRSDFSMMHWSRRRPLLEILGPI